MPTANVPPAASAPGSATATAGRLGSAVLIGLSLIAVASLVAVLIARPDGIVLSADPGASALPVWALVLPPIAVIALALLLPSPGTSPVVVVEPRRAIVSTLALVVCAVTFTLVARLPSVAGSELYILAKLLILIAVPAAVVAVLRPAVAFKRPSGSSRVWAPVLLVVVWALLAKVAPWNPTHDYSGIDPVFLIVAGLATALTAGVGEELFYRRWLQTRLEALLGSWPGIALGAVAFALMHLGSHGSGEVLLDIAVAIVSQGSFGLMLGILWWRFRMLWPIITIHVLVNGWELVPAILG